MVFSFVVVLIWIYLGKRQNKICSNRSKDVESCRILIMSVACTFFEYLSDVYVKDSSIERISRWMTIDLFYSVN